MPLPTATIDNQGTIVEVQLLPLGSRTPTNYTITMGATAAPAGATTLTVAALPTFLQSETRLTFGATTAILVNDANAAATSLTVEPLTGAIAAAATSITIAALQLLGVTDASVNASSNTVDTSNFKSGYGMESKVTGLDRTVSVSLNQIQGDRALDTIIKPIIYNDAFAMREVFARITCPNGEKYEGAAIVRNVNQPKQMRDISKMTLEFQFQGSKTFKFTPAP